MNPSTQWNSVPIWGAYFKGDGITPVTGNVRFTFNQRVSRVDGRMIYPEGHTVERVIGESPIPNSIEADAMEKVRASWRAADEVAAGTNFDTARWDAWWDTWVTGAVFASFPASDDPDIVETGYQVQVVEQLSGSSGKTYYITPLLASLQATPPGLNLGLVAVPPGTPTAPAPVYAKGVPGGVAALDADGNVVDANGNVVSGGAGSGVSRTEVTNLLSAHSVDPTPHSAYDDLPSLRLLFENGLV